MKARDRGVSWVNASDGLKVLLGGSTLKALHWARLVPAILPKGLIQLNKDTNILFPYFYKAYEKLPFLATLECT